MRLRLPFASLALIAAVAACSSRDPVAENANGAALPAPASEAAPSPVGAPPANETAPASSTTTNAATIPAALQGRWGLTPADCTSPLGDAKGLLVIGGSELRFYESRAVPSPAVQSDADSITGNFHFTGEGQSWMKFETLRRQKDKLVRTDSNPTASFTYAKC